MSKLKLGVLFGGMSSEHDVSITSGTSVIKNLNKDKYEIYPIYIDKNEGILMIVFSVLTSCII